MSTQIAIVGMSCRYPDADTVDELFENSLAQRRAFRTLPPKRLAAEYFDPSGQDTDRSYARQAAVINGFEFDRDWYRVPRQSYDVTDLTHWLALTVARETIEDIHFRSLGGHPHNDAVRVVVANTLAGEFSRSGLMRLRWPYVKRMVAEHLRQEDPDIDEGELLRRLGELEQRYKQPFPTPNEDLLAGGLANTIAGRICNHFDFKGGGYTVDGACASSLLAVSDACTALVAGDADMVLAGGVDLSLDPFELVGFSRSAALARTEMLVYDEQSEGFWPGEGCGFVALMRYSEAVEQCERIYGVISGWGISSDGRGGLTRPESEGQQLALRRCYARAGYGIESVGYFEGHGTGTKVGDAAELDALITARLDSGEPVQRAVISSIKANIGHTKAAAGLAGLLRATKCVGEHILPPTTACRQPHPLLVEHGENLTTSPRPQSWPSGTTPRRAGVSAMGFGGINAHVTIEEAPSPSRKSIAFSDGAHLGRLASFQDAELFLFAASSRKDLMWTVNRIADIAGELSRSDLTDLAIELARRATRDMLRIWKGAVVASTPVELSTRLRQLQQVIEAADDDAIHLDTTDGLFLSGADAAGAVGLVFSGQGSPARHDGGIHAVRFEEVRHLYEDADLLSFDDRTDTDFAQPAIVTASVAGLRMLQRIGLSAEVAVGHSLGELTALHWAGHFDESSLLDMARVRGRATVDGPFTSGAMAAIAADQEVTHRLIGDRADIVVANINAPRQTVVSGRPEAVEDLVSKARRDGIAATTLPVRTAFHSPAMARVADVFGGWLDDFVFRPAERRVISSATGRALREDADLLAHLRNQLVEPVQFMAAVRAAAPDVDLFVEVGPGELLTRLVSSITDTPVTSIDVAGQSMAPYLRTSGALFVLGCAPTIAKMFDDRFARRFDWNWKPRFFENPCETYATEAADPDPGPASVDARRPMVGDTLDRGAGTRDQLRQVIADHTGLPAWTFEDSSRMSSDLHLNSITVSEIVVRVAVARGLLTPVDPADYADASIDEIATALDHLAEIGPVARSDRSGSTRGIANWVRDFEVVRGPAEPLIPGDPRGHGEWEVFGAPTSDGDDLLRCLNSEALGSGVLVWLDADLGSGQLNPLLPAAQRCAARARESGAPLRFVVVQHGWGASGFARSFYLEQTPTDVLVVNLPRTGGIPTTDWVAREIAGMPGGFREVFIDVDGSRQAPRLQHCETSTATTPLLDRDDVVLITGGGKGISAECGFQLARRTGCALLVLGRSAPDESPELERNLDRLRLAGVRLSYRIADVTDPDAVLEAVAAGTAELGAPVTGIVHGAGLNHPRTVVDLTAADLESTLAPKVDGLGHVLAAVDPTRLKLLSTFSSIIARIGLEGEADYALANEWLSHRTEEFQRTHPRCRCSAIEWSVWSGAGMGQRLGRLDALELRGIFPISVDDGVSEFLRIVDTPDLPTRLVVSGRFGSPGTIDYHRPMRERSRFVESVLVHHPDIELVAECKLDPDSDPYLDDHVLEHERLFPAVMAMEAMAEAVAVLLDRDVDSPGLEFSGLSFRTAIVVPAVDTGDLVIRLVALAGRDGEISVAIRCSSTEFQMNHVEARCRVHDNDPIAHRPTSNEPARRDVEPFDPNRSLYDNVLFQRGRFRRIDGYQMIEARRCSGRIGADGAARWFADGLPQSLVLGDAGARDAALHAIQACIPHKVVIPIAVEQVRTCALDPSSAHFMFATEVADRGDELVYDLRISDPDGRTLEYWRNIVLRIVGQPPGLRLDSPLLMAPVFERRVADSAPDAHVEVTFVGSKGGRRSGNDRSDLRHRPDGKPDPSAASRFRSAAYAGQWKLVVAAAVPVGCDLEAVAHREAGEWESLLGPEGFKLARVVRGLIGEGVDISATRVWTVLEAIKKVGLRTTAPVVVDPESDADWVVFRSGDSTIYSSAVAATPTEAAICVTTALLGP